MDTKNIKTSESGNDAKREKVRVIPIQDLSSMINTELFIASTIRQKCCDVFAVIGLSSKHLMSRKQKGGFLVRQAKNNQDYSRTRAPPVRNSLRRRLCSSVYPQLQ